MPDPDKWIGIPYKEMDCWTLVASYMREELGVSDFPMFDEYVFQKYLSGDEWGSHAVRKYAGSIEPVQKPTIGDFILYRFGGRWHAGVIIPPGDRFLHSTEKFGSVITVLNHRLYRKIPRTFYRWVGSKP